MSNGSGEDWHSGHGGDSAHTNDYDAERYHCHLTRIHQSETLHSTQDVIQALSANLAEFGQRLKAQGLPNSPSSSRRDGGGEGP